MRLNLDTNIFRHMSDGVVVLDRHGKVVSFNRTGEPWVPSCRSLEFVFRRAIEEERQGRLQLPMDLHGLTGRQTHEAHPGQHARLYWVHQSQRVLALIRDSAGLGTLARLLAQVSEQLGPGAGAHYIRLHADVSTMAPVYGNAAWLGYALQSLLQYLLQSSDYRCAIYLAVKPLGNFVVVSGHVANPLPEVQTTTRPDLHGAHAGVADWPMREMLCQRIVDLHGGKLKLSMNPDATPPQPGERPSLDAFTLTLMTGLPDSDRSRASCQNCRHVQQELAYAADLARVLGTSPPLNPGDQHHAQDTHR